jgi:hypothetical protein
VSVRDNSFVRAQVRRSRRLATFVTGERATILRGNDT